LRSAVIAFALLAAGGLLVPASSAQDGTADVRIEDQTSGGTTVSVAEVSLPEAGFVAIHDASLSDGEVLGSVVGSSGHLAAGTHEDVTVQLSQPLDEDAQLVAMPHEDTNDDRIYSFVAENGNVDGPFTADGNAVTDAAEVTASASVSASDQPTDGGSVIVDRVEMEDGGFVAIHDDRVLQGKPIASVIGNSTYLEAGVHEDVRVELQTTVTQEETVVAMPHRDSDGDRNYDFVASEASEDPPYRNAEDEAVVDDAQAQASEEARVTFESQSTGGHVVTVAEAFVPAGGFVTIHDSSLQQGAVLDSVRGTSGCLEPGVHRDITVQLDDSSSEDDTLIAMPHKDTDDDCDYDFVTSGGDDDGPYTKDGSAVTDGGQATVSASVDYATQASDGRTIVVDHVDLGEPGFVAVHDPSLLAGQVLDSVVGHSSFLQAGSHEDVEIQLSEPVRTTQTLIPMPHKDTDDDEEYRFPQSGGEADGPFLNGDDKPVVDTGLTHVRAQVTIEGQDATSSVSVASVTMHEGGFVTLHDASLLDGAVLDSVVGVSDKLGPGTHEDVQVSLDEAPEGEAQLIAMPHKDTNGNDAYDFVTSEGSADGPYVTGEGAIVHVASVAFPTSSSGDDGSPAEGASADDSTEDAAGPGLGVTLAALAAVGLSAARKRD
jgi:hypothetical protein